MFIGLAPEDIMGDGDNSPGLLYQGGVYYYTGMFATINFPNICKVMASEMQDGAICGARRPSFVAAPLRARRQDFLPK